MRVQWNNQLAGMKDSLPNPEIDDSISPDHPAKEHSQAFTGRSAAHHRNTVYAGKEILQFKNRIRVRACSQCIFQ